VPEAGPRGALVDYIGVEEAVRPPQPGLVLSYQPTQVTRYSASGDPGEVFVRSSESEALQGWFDLPVAHVSGRFRATACQEDPALFEILVAAPLASCTSGR
jgi:hypothetical protein